VVCANALHTANAATAAASMRFFMAPALFIFISRSIDSLTVLIARAKKVKQGYCQQIKPLL
jgi:hypothetical protein